MASAKHPRDQSHHPFECSCHCAVRDTLVDDDDGETPTVDDLRCVPFGEFLVGQRAIDRHQLLRGLQMQDDHPGVRLGECLVALGLIPPAEVENHLGSWRRAHPLEA